MSESKAELSNDSYERCMRRSGFLDRFYEIVMASSEVVARKFAHTDFQKQKRLLKASLYLLMLAADPPPEVTVHLERLAELHSKRQLDIHPELYNLWLDCMLQTVAEFDPVFDEAIEAAWRNVFITGIQILRSGYG